MFSDGDKLKLANEDHEFKKLIFENSPLPIVIVDAETLKIVDCNEAAIRNYRQQSINDLIGKTPMDFSPAIQSGGIPTSDKAKSNIDIVLNGKNAAFEWTHETNGETWVTEVHLTSFNMSGKKYIQGLYVDITERKKAESELQKEKMFIEKLLDNLPAIFYLFDSNLRLKRWNRKCIEILGYSEDELSEMSIDVLSGNVASDGNFKNIISKGCSISKETVLLTKKGESIPFLVNGIILDTNDGQMLMGIGVDISEIKRSEAEKQKLLEHLNNSQRLESLGTLAGGIAHDFNNLLTGTYGYIDLAREETVDSKIRHYLNLVLDTMERARALTMQLLTFAKGGAPVQKLTALEKFLQETVQFALSGSNISCTFNISTDLLLCNIDKNQICQVIDNIVINAKQAMLDGGKIEVSAENVLISENSHLKLAAGKYVKVSIKDTGSGMSAEIMSHIFDPFFTTKERGHGLGLATCYSIVKRHGGCIDVESELSKGTTFRIYLPASEEKLLADRVENTKVVQSKGSGKIIVMDDEEVIRVMFTDMLQSLGYTAICKSDSREIIEIIDKMLKDKQDLYAVILDMTISGGAGGVEVIKEIRKLSDSLPVFVISGYADNYVMRNPSEYGFNGSLIKPFTVTDIRNLLRNI